jgi:hypothetical protein
MPVEPLGDVPAHRLHRSLPDFSADSDAGAEDAGLHLPRIMQVTSLIDPRTNLQKHHKLKRISLNKKLNYA